MTSNEKFLLVGRHAEADPSLPKLGDKFRTLTERGFAQAQGNGDLLNKVEMIPTCIIRSDALRIEQTRDHMVRDWKTPSQDVIDARLYDITKAHLTLENTLPFFQSVLENADDAEKRLMILGHNNAVGQLANILTNDAVPALWDFPSATIAIFSVAAGSWSEITPETCTLEHILLDGKKIITTRPQGSAGAPAPAAR